MKPGTDNVFADLELSNSSEALAKAELARRISGLLRERGLNQSDAAELLGVDQPKISALARGRLQGFSTDRLLRFLTALRCNVDIVVRNSAGRKPGRIRVVPK